MPYYYKEKERKNKDYNFDLIIIIIIEGIQSIEAHNWYFKIISDINICLEYKSWYLKLVFICNDYIRNKIVIFQSFYSKILSIIEL